MNNKNSENTNPNSESYDFDNLKRKPSKIKYELVKARMYVVVISSMLILAFLLLRIDDVLKVIGSFLSILSPLFYGLAFAFLLNPLTKFFEKYITKLMEEKIKVKKQSTVKKTARGLGIFLSIALVLALVYLILNMMLPQLYRSIRMLIIVLPAQMDNFIDKLSAFVSEKGISDNTTQYINEMIDSFEVWIRHDFSTSISKYMSAVTAGLTGVVGGVFNVIIGIIIAVYILISKEKFAGQNKKVMYALLNTDKVNFILSVVRKSNEIFSGFLIGKIIDSAIIGVICFIGMSIFGFTDRYTLLISVFVAVTNIIPFFGPYIGAIPSTILIMLESPIHALYFIIFILVLQQLDGNVIGPKILGNSTGLSAFWVVIAILIGGGLFGFVGMIIGVPTFAVLYYLFRMIINEKLKKKSLPVSSNEYVNAARIDMSGTDIQGNEANSARRIVELKDIKDETQSNDRRQSNKDVFKETIIKVKNWIVKMIKTLKERSDKKE